MNEYIAIDSGGYLCTNSSHIIAAWLDAAKKNQDGVRLKRFTREKSVNHFEQS